MKKVLHYKTNFLNKSETFIKRLVQNHIAYQPVALCYRKKSFNGNLTIHEVPQKGRHSWVNFAAFHSNLSLPYYHKILKQEKPDLIHAHFGYDAMKLITLARKYNIPLLVSFYGTDVSRLPSEFGWKTRYKRLAEEGTHFIAATTYMKSQLIDLGFPEDKISIVRFGIELNGCIKKDSTIPAHNIMMVGRMVEKKGFEYGIKAISKLGQKGINAELDLYGYGPDMNLLKKLTANLDLQDKIHFHGYQPIEAIFEAHDHHSILLAPSVTAKDGDMEGLPNTILESMAKGTAVVATRHAAIPEVVEDGKTGFLVDERDEASLSDVIEKIILGDFDLEEIRINARRVIEDQYGIQKMVSEVERIYDQITR